MFAAIDGDVDQVFVEHGDRVVAPNPAAGVEGTLLAKLRAAT